MLLKNATFVTPAPVATGVGDLRVEGGSIVARSKSLQPKPGEQVIDLTGKVVLPGFVNAHTHLYSALARGMRPPTVAPKNFLQILQRVWWKLDRALDEETIFYSAIVGALDAALSGTTALVDHHASPNAISASLDIVKEAMEEIGLRGLLCYETTDRNGAAGRDAGLQENERFISANLRSQQFRGLVGAHASFTMSDASLRSCGDLAAQYKTGVHIHVAEDLCDVADARNRHSSSVIDRLRKHGILRKETILAHCVHLTGRDFPKVHKANCWLVHNPRSNMNNRVGYAPVAQFGQRAALGTDGFPADMIAEAAFGFFKQQDARGKTQANMLNLLGGGQRIFSEAFGVPFGTLAKGSVADLVVMDYQPPTPMTPENAGGHLLFGMNASMVQSVMVNGKWIVQDRQIPDLDMPAVYEKARKAAARLWQKMDKLA